MSSNADMKFYGIFVEQNWYWDLPILLPIKIIKIKHFEISSWNRFFENKQIIFFGI